MALMELLAARFGSRPRIAITGCGGKTSLMIVLAEEYARRGRSVLMTTTTKVRSPYELDYGCDVVQLDSYDHVPHCGERVFFAMTYDGRKVRSPELALLAEIADGYDAVLMEADGSRGLPLKYHNPWDPVIPRFTTDVVAIAGMSALDRPLDDATVFNYGAYLDASADTDATVSERTILNLLRLDEGIRKGFADSDGGADRRGVVFFNQCDILAPERLARTMASLGTGHLYGSVEKDVVYGEPVGV